jgi:Fe-S cluster assembly scaffold protein SufB
VPNLIKEFESYVKELSLSKKEPEWLLKQRLKALNLFKNLPNETSPVFQKYKDWSNVKIDKINLLHDDLNPIANFNEISLKFKEKGAIIDTIFNSLSRYDVIKDVLENTIEKFDDKFACLTQALFNFGYFVYVPKDVKIEEPLLLSSNIEKDIFIQGIVILDENAKLTIVQKDLGKKDAFHSENTFVALKEGSSLNFISIQFLSKYSQSITNRIAVCDKDSKVLWAIGLLGSLLTKSKVITLLNGDGSEAKDLEFIFGNLEQKFDILSKVIHFGSQTNGLVLARSALKDKASSLLKGLIRVEREAINSKSYLDEHGIILGREARAYALPSLEIETNEVKATHSSSISQIEDDLIFYLMSRGISEDDAKKLVVLGFLQPILSKIPVKDVRLKVKEMFDAKWKGLE